MRLPDDGKAAVAARKLGELRGEHRVGGDSAQLEPVPVARVADGLPDVRQRIRIASDVEARGVLPPEREPCPPSANEGKRGLQRAARTCGEEPRVIHALEAHDETHELRREKRRSFCRKVAPLRQNRQRRWAPPAQRDHGRLFPRHASAASVPGAHLRRRLQKRLGRNSVQHEERGSARAMPVSSTAARAKRYLGAMNVADLVRAMEEVAPTRLAAAWDNVGLLVGDARAPVSRVLLTIDCTRAVLDEARAGGAQAIVSYHPPLFAAQKRFLAGGIAFEATRAGIAVYSPHTALDVAEGGTNDVLADVLGMKSRASLRPVEGRDIEWKLVTFVPADHVEAVSSALFAAGAGRIGKYSSCSFRTPGTGTFFGEQGADPTVGQAGRLEHAPEVRLETVVPIGRAEAAVRALRGAHPYEEPAFDLVRLAAVPEGLGFGRVGDINPADIRVLVDQVKSALAVEHVLAAGPLDREVRRVAVCAGSGGDLVDDALAARAELLLTGELRHHDALRAVENGLTIVCTRHSSSERAALLPLEARLSSLLPGVAVTRSVVDRDPFAFT